MKVLIGVPTGQGLIRPETVSSIYNLELPDGCQRELYIAQGYGLARARNLIAAKAVDEGFDYIFTTDDDMVFPSDTLIRLLALDADMASAWAMQMDGTTNIAKYEPEQNHYRCVPREELPPDGVVDVDAMGLACMLIKTKVYAQLNYPYHVWQEYINRTCLSEDLYICDRLKKWHAPVSIKADMSLKADHLKVHAI